MAVFSDLELVSSEAISKGIFPILILMSIADQERVKEYYSRNPEHRFNNLRLTENQILVECCSDYTDIPTGSKFDIIFADRDVENFVNVSAVLEYASFNRSFEVDRVPNKITSVVVLINFPEGKPEILNKLRFQNEKRDINKYDELYLTEKKVMEKILKELDGIKE